MGSSRLLLRRSSDQQSSLTLAKHDVVKIHLGAHIDGFASISAETVVVGATEQDPTTGRRADVVKAAWHAAELAQRLIKVDNKNWAVTEGVNKVAAAWDCKAVEGRHSSSKMSHHALAVFVLRHALLPALQERHRWKETDHIGSFPRTARRL